MKPFKVINKAHIINVFGLAYIVKKSPVLRFLSAGSVTFLCEYLVFYILYIFWHWHLLLANSLSFGAGLCVSFTLNRSWAFKKQSYQRKFNHQAGIYLILAFLNLIMNNVIVGSLKFIGLDPRIGKIIAIITIAAWNFAIYQTVIFREKKTER